MQCVCSVLAFLTADTALTNMLRRGQRVFLSFDDGQHPERMPPLLDLQKAHGVKTTFFFIGHLAQRHPNIVQGAVGEGYAISKHSMTHPRMPRVSARARTADIDAADGVPQRLSGRRLQLFRPPNGRATVITILDSVRRRKPLVLWTVTRKDCELGAEQVIARMAHDVLGGGDILPFHDEGGVDAARARFLPHWQGGDLSLAPL